MIKILGSIPKKLTVALSGGVDSMVALDFFKRKHDVDAAFFHHGTLTSDQACFFLEEYCSKNNITLHKGVINDSDCPKGLSKEEYWRDQRYNFLSQFETVVSGHHLDDVVETWIWSSLHGTSSLIPYRRNNVIRPFLLTRKSELLDWANRKGVPWVNDMSNHDCSYTRNYIRNKMMPDVLRVNPGIHTMVKKKLVERGVDIK
jgi:tRNA(Ile)-lysidine synthase